MMAWIKKQLDKSKDDGGMEEKRTAIKCKRESAESAIRLLKGEIDPRGEDHGNPEGPERRHGIHLAHTDPLPQV